MAVLPQEGGNVLGGREVQFLSRQESNYPQLMRLCMDFDFSVLEVMNNTDGAIAKQFLLTTQDYRLSDSTAITPAFNNLAALEAHVETEMVEILHNYLFGFVDEEMELIKQNMA